MEWFKEIYCLLIIAEVFDEDRYFQRLALSNYGDKN